MSEEVGFDFVPCLVELSKLYEKPMTGRQITKGLPIEGESVPLALVPRAAQHMGMMAERRNIKANKIDDKTLPCILLMNDGSGVILTSIEADLYTIFNTTEAAYEELTLVQLNERYSDECFMFMNTAIETGEATSNILNDRHWFWRAIWISKDIYKDVLLASVMINLFALVSPLFVMNVYDRVVPNQALDTLATLAIAAFIIFTFDFVYKLIRSHYLDLAGKKADVIISSTIFEKVLRTKLANRPNSTGSFAKNLSDFESIRDFVTSATMTSFVDFPFVFLFIAVIAIISGPLALSPLLIVIVITIVSFYISVKVRAAVEKTYEASAVKNGALIESINSVESIKLFRAENSRQRAWERATVHIAQWSQKSRFLSQAASFFVAYATQLNTICVVCFGVFMIFDGDLSMGALIATVILSGRALAPMAQLSSLIIKYHNASVAYKGLDDIMSAPDEQPRDKRYLQREHFKGKYQAANVGFSFAGSEHQFFAGLDFEIEAGDKVGVIGKIGSGKSTILRLLTGLYEPVSGAVLLDGVDLRQIDPNELRANIGCLTQNCELFSGTIRENIVLGKPDATDDELRNAVINSGVEDFIGVDPEGIDKQVGERGRLLSGGQRQAVALARALLMDAPILILDEPTSNLDKASERRLMGRLHKVFKNKTVVLFTHNSEMLALVDKLMVLDRGRVIAFGPKGEILQKFNSKAAAKKEAK